jgi:hypothetical protein
MITDRRLAAVALAAVLAAPAFAGCLGSAQASAMDQEGAAEDRARQWDEDAQLALVMGVEGDFAAAMSGNYSYSGWSGSGWGGSSSSGWGDSGWDGSRGDDLRTRESRQAETQQDSSSSYWQRAEEDDSRGDGEAVVWMYLFVSPNKPEKVFKVVVDEEGEILDAEEEDREGDLAALGEWSVDSDRAAEIAVENNDGIQAASESENDHFFYILDDQDDHENPVWGIAAVGGDESGGGGGYVEIDAQTGDVLESEGGSYSR